MNCKSLTALVASLAMLCCAILVVADDETSETAPMQLSHRQRTLKSLQEIQAKLKAHLSGEMREYFSLAKSIGGAFPTSAQAPRAETLRASHLRITALNDIAKSLAAEIEKLTIDTSM